MPLDEALTARMARRKLAHAYVITGRDRFKLADTLAAALVCTGVQPPCRRCNACRKAGEHIHPDVMWINPEGEKFGVDDVRDVRNNVYVMPNEAETKVYVFCHSELLNPQSQNALLKVIEEGPPYSRFLFLTPNLELLLPTIRSRCETLRTSVEEETEATEEGAKLADYILNQTPPAEILPFLVSLEKRERKEIAVMLKETYARLTEASAVRPDLLPVLDRLDPILAACEFNISAGHLAGWIASAL